MSADPKQYATLFPVAQKAAAQVLPVFQAEIEKRATPEWGDAPRDPSWVTARSGVEGPVRIGPRIPRRPFRLLPDDAPGRIPESWPKHSESPVTGPVRFRPYADGNDRPGRGGLDQGWPELAHGLGLEP